MSNIKKFLSDPQLWDKPDLFSPDRLHNKFYIKNYIFLSFRFLDTFGKFFRPDHFVPLGHGRRVCMGEPLARAELFIFFVSLVQRIRLETVPGKIPDPEQYSAGLTRCPHDFVVAVKQRRAVHG